MVSALRSIVGWAFVRNNERTNERHSIFCYVCVMASVVLDLLSSVLRQEIGWEELLVRSFVIAGRGPAYSGPQR